MNNLCIRCFWKLRPNQKWLLPLSAAAHIVPARIRGTFSGSTLVQISPKSFRPYLRLIRIDKPTGFWLLYWPCTWSIGLAAPAGSLPDWRMLALFGAGAVLMRSAGCIVNDIFDKEYDKLVERTRTRPLASGELSEREAIAFLAVLLSASLSILLQFNWLSVAVGAGSLSLVIAYPLAKRYTYWPQFVLGLAFNWGILLGWTAVNDQLHLPVVLPLYLASLNWTLIYDTIYAHQDRTDDLIAGVKSTALLFGDRTKYWLTGFAAATLLGLGTTGAMIQQTWPFYAALTITGAQLAWQIGTVNIDDPNDCWRKFKTNQWLGVILFTGIIAGNLLRKEEERNKEEEEEQSASHS